VESELKWFFKGQSNGIIINRFAKVFKTALQKKLNNFLQDLFQQTSFSTDTNLQRVYFLCIYKGEKHWKIITRLINF
jgi:hypothetical protein